jgi:inorganic pyrophosphatase
MKEVAGVFMKQKENELENNVYFWQKLDTLVYSSKIVIDRPKGSANPHYKSLIYPVDSGYLKETMNSSSTPVYIYRGSLSSLQVNAVIVQADILARDCLAKLLIGCTDEECALILKFINTTEFQKAIMVRRSNNAPKWASSEA